MKNIPCKSIVGVIFSLANKKLSTITWGGKIGHIREAKDLGERDQNIRMRKRSELPESDYYNQFLGRFLIRENFGFVHVKNIIN